MPFFPEKEPKLGVEVTPEVPAIPPDIRQAGVVPVSTQPPAVVQTEGAEFSATSQASQETIELPADKTTLVSWSKGPASSSSTWLGALGIRLMKKARHFGWRIGEG